MPQAGKKLQIGILLALTVPAGRDKMSGVLCRVNERSHTAVLFNSLSSEEVGKANRLIRTGVVDGVVGDFKPSTVRACTKRHVPYVGINPNGQVALPQAGVGIVQIDNAAIARCTAETLRKRGFTRFAYVGSERSNESFHSHIREQTFQTEVAAAGEFLGTFSCDRARESATDELVRMADWLAALHKPCAVMAYCDTYARRLYDAANLAHVNIPEQLGIISVDNDMTFCETLTPSLSSVLPDFKGGGYLAVRLLEQMIGGEVSAARPTLTYGVKAVFERGSTQDLRCGGRTVVRAQEFIARHAHERISVADVARGVGVSRCLLGIHFRRILGRTVLEELNGLRLTRVEQRLRETNHPISQIADASGFGSEDALQRAFLRKHGLTMREWRRTQNP